MPVLPHAKEHARWIFSTVNGAAGTGFEIEVTYGN